jgi:transcriptional regulator with XRE-family HTH domain
MRKIYTTGNENNIYKQLRVKANLRQYEVAKILSTRPQTVSKWECGLTIPDQAILPKIAELYNTTVDYLLTGKDYQSVQQQPQERPLSEIEIIYNQLNDAQKERVKGYIMGMLEDEGVDLDELLKTSLI